MREIDPSHFHLHNVTDTCATWHILSSHRLFRAACSAGCSFILTSFVCYECLHKRRKQQRNEDIELQQRLRQEMQRRTFTQHALDLEDLQDVQILENRKKLGKGELSAIALAQKIDQAFLTDDHRGARQLAEQVMQPEKVQTTPHLFGWLFFTGMLSDSDKDIIIKEHNQFKTSANDPSLERHFETIYLRALHNRLLTNKNGNSDAEE